MSHHLILIWFQEPLSDWLVPIIEPSKSTDLADYHGLSFLEGHGNAEAPPITEAEQIRNSESIEDSDELPSML